MQLNNGVKMGTEDKLKKIGKYKITYNQSLEAEGDNVILNISLNKETQTLLNELVINEVIKTGLELEHWFFDEDNIKTLGFKQFPRYKIKRAVYSELMGRYKELLFLTDLLKNGLVCLEVTSFKESENIRNELARTFKEIVRIYLQIDLKQEVLFSNEQ